MLTVTRKTTETPIENVRIAIVAKSVKLVPTKVPMTVFRTMTKAKREDANSKEALT